MSILSVKIYSKLLVLNVRDKEAELSMSKEYIKKAEEANQIGSNSFLHYRKSKINVEALGKLKECGRQV